MKDSCKELLTHISRLEGQLRALKTVIEGEGECEKVVHLGLSASKSFDALRTKVVEAYLREHILEGKTLSTKREKEFAQIKKLMIS
jgi:DNA-binding FrmR family transcriptional regulator